MIDDLEKRERELLDELACVRREIEAEKLLMAKAGHGVYVGCVVVAGNGLRHLVTMVDTRFSGKPWLSGNPEKKDGTWSKAVRNLYSDWELES